MARHDIELMEHADGEHRLDLTAAERDKVAAIGEVGELVRGHLELAADAVPAARFEAMWRQIDASIDKAIPEAAPARMSLWSRLGQWFEHYRSHIIVGAASAGAVAALAIVIGPTSHDAGVALEVRPAAMRSAPAVESVDTPNGGSWNLVEVDDEDSHAAVIWVTPQDTVEGI
jgi:hypothetical protein